MTKETGHDQKTCDACTEIANLRQRFGKMGFAPTHSLTLASEGLREFTYMFKNNHEKDNREILHPLLVSQVSDCLKNQ